MLRSLSKSYLKDCFAPRINTARLVSRSQAMTERKSHVSLIVSPLRISLYIYIYIYIENTPVLEASWVVLLQWIWNFEQQSKFTVKESRANTIWDVLRPRGKWSVSSNSMLDCSVFSLGYIAYCGACVAFMLIPFREIVLYWPVHDIFRQTMPHSVGSKRPTQPQAMITRVYARHASFKS